MQAQVCGNLLPKFCVVGQVGLEPTTALSTAFTERGDTNYTVLAYIGGPDASRTRYIYLARVALSQLSYRPIVPDFRCLGNLTFKLLESR